MNVGFRWWTIWAVVLALPMGGFALLLAEPAWDRNFMARSFHFYVVSGTALAAAVACALIISLTDSLRETRLVFLGLAFLSIAAIFSVHGLATPGHIHSTFHTELVLSSWLSVFTGACFIALSTTPLPPAVDDSLKRYSGLVFGGVTLAVGAYVGLSITAPGWLDWVPIDNRPLQYAATVITLMLLGLGAWRYFQAYLFARLFAQWAMVVALLLLVEVQIALTWGRTWHVSWWLYHVTYAVAFLVLFAGWFLEARRAGSIRVIAEALSMRDAIAQLNRGYSQPIADLVDAIEWKDLYTYGHVRRVASYAVMIGKQLHLPTLELRNLALSAQMHDVGKISVPDRILTKPGRLTPEEFAVIKQHVARGAEIAARVPTLRVAADGILYHHEKMDGSGYPKGLRGEEIPLQARIVAVADAFDAMTSGRVYQPAITNEAAIAELQRRSGSHFDPQCVRAFVAALSILPKESTSTPRPTSPVGGRQRDSFKENPSELVLIPWSRGLITAFWATALLTWLWAMPGLPFGLSGGDYNGRVVSVLLLCGASILTAGLALILRAKVSHSHTELRRLAFYDPLTGLANRALFLDRLEHAVEQARQRRELIALLFLDLDQFKSINDRFGHAAGDHVLLALGERLRRCVRAGDTVGRLGGDEFTVLLENVEDVSTATEVAERIIEEIRAPFSSDYPEMLVSVSIGIALSDEGAVQPTEFLRDADAALYLAKANGKGQCVLFTGESTSPAATGIAA